MKRSHKLYRASLILEHAENIISFGINGLGLDSGVRNVLRKDAEKLQAGIAGLQTLIEEMIALENDLNDQEKLEIRNRVIWKEAK